MAGRVVAIQVDYLTETPEGPQRTVVDLAAMLRHCGPERVDDLLDDLTMLCEDVQTAGRPSVALLRRIT
jgi:hypothetical protein